MKTKLPRAEVLNKVGESLQARYGKAPIPSREIKREAAAAGGFKESGIIPSDFCYNCINEDPISMTDPLFQKTGVGLYVFLGRNYPFSGTIFWKPTGLPRRQVGEWIDGKCHLCHDPRKA